MSVRAALLVWKGDPGGSSDSLVTRAHDRLDRPASRKGGNQ